VTARAAPVAAAVEAGLAAAAIVVFGAWAQHDGGYAPEEWLPGGLLLLALLAAALCSTDVRARLLRVRYPLMLLGLYVGWSYASVAWAKVPGDALDGANRTLVYWLVFALFAGLALERWGTPLVVCWCGGVAVLGVVALADAASAQTPAGHFVLGRLAAPIAYPDADAALFLSAALPLVVLASRRAAHVALRAAGGAVAVVLVALAVMSQSRGSVVALIFALALYVVVARAKLRALAHIAVVAAASVPALPALLAVYTAVVDGANRSGAIRHAGAWIAIDAVIGALGCAALAYLDHRLEISARTRDRIGKTVLATAGLAFVLAVALAFALAHPLARASTAWHDFTTYREPKHETLHFTAGLATSRSDVWRIALQEFAAHPLGGLGSDNFLVADLAQRRTHEVARYPESWELRALTETGIVGALLFFGFIALALRNAWRGARRVRSPSLALACFAGCGYWLMHASIDWFWEFPALTAPAFALLALAGTEHAVAMPAATTRPVRIGATVARVVAIAAAAAILTMPWIAVSLTDEAVALGPTQRAYSLLRRASSLDPLSAQPALSEASLAAAAGERGREWNALELARRRNPFDTYTHLMLGIVAGRQHRRTVARRELAQAHRLSPQDLVVVYAQRRLRIGEPLTEREIGEILAEIDAPFRGVRQR
jgi:O-antigen ligase/polysaccharide polymerase Wzy-like membrane protein